MNSENLVSFDNTSVAFSSRSDKELKQMHLLFSGMNLGQVTKIGTYFVKTALSLKLPVQKVIKNTLFKQFCGGESLEECKKVIASLSSFGIQTVLDYAVEGGSKENSYDTVVARIEQTIDFASGNPDVPFCVFKASALCDVKILEKLQEGEKLNAKESAEFDQLKERMENICRLAKEKNVKILVDAEESWIQDAIDALVYNMMARYNKDTVIIYNTYQMYRADMLYNLGQALEQARSGNYFLGVKLVRGAYLDLEREKAKKNGVASPLYNTKQETDDAFDEALRFCMNNLDRIFLCSGTHNEVSNLLQVALIKKHRLSEKDPRVYFSQLYGMGDHISYNLAAKGYNVTKYVPFGPVGAVIPYLIRRAQENRAMTGQTSRELGLIRRERRRRKVNSEK